MGFKILVTEPLAQAGIDVFEAHGSTVDVRLGLSPEELAGIIGGYDALIVRSSTKVTKQLIDAAPRLKIVGRAGVGVDNIDIDACSEAGVLVCNAPESNLVSAAEHTMALMMAAARNIPQASALMKRGAWERTSFVGRELYDKTLAIFGLGRIGGLVAKRAAAFGMHLIGYDPYCQQDRADSLGVDLVADMDEVLARADFVTVHLPRTSETIGMFGREEFQMIKPGAIVVNTSRGGIYDLDALAEAMRDGQVAACGIDVWEEEPCYESPLHDLPNAVITPHLGAATIEAQTRAGVQIAEYVSGGLEGSIVPTSINMAPVPPEVFDLLGPYTPAVQALARMLAQISPDVPRKITVTAAGTIANADLTVLVAGALSGFISADEDRVTAVNVDDVAKRHGIKVERTSRIDAEEYASFVEIAADGRRAACTLAGAGQKLRIINLLGYKIDIMPQQHSLIFVYHDGPGRMGTIGTILGDAGISITTMQIGTREDSTDALVYMNVDREVPPSVLERLERAIVLKGLWYIRL